MEVCRECAAEPETFLVSWTDNAPAYVCRVCGTPHPERRLKVVYDSSTFQPIKVDRVGRTIPKEIL